MEGRVQKVPPHTHPSTHTRTKPPQNQKQQKPAPPAPQKGQKRQMLLSNHELRVKSPQPLHETFLPRD